jgi:uncharacterized protein YlxW (UPF0749 family)
MTGHPDLGLSGRRTSRDDGLSLLSRIVDDAIDPGYSDLAGRDMRSQQPRAGWGHSVILAAALLALGALTTAAVIQTQRGAPDEERARNDLLGRVAAATADTDALVARVDDLTARTAAVSADALSGSSNDQALSDRVQNLEAAVGITSVTGPGLEVVLTDGPPDPAGNDGPDLARVLDQDLQLAVNGLYAAGAEAVSINGQRLTSLSAIRGAGDAVLVGYRPISPPYVVTAIGDPVRMEREFANGAAAAQLRSLAGTYGMGFDTETEEALTVPGSAELTMRYATSERRS